MDHVQGRAVLHGHGVRVGDGHLHGGLGLDLFAVLFDGDVEEAREGDVDRLHAQLRRGIGQVPVIVLAAGQDLLHLQPGAHGDFCLGAVIQGDLIGLAVEGLVPGLQGIAQHDLREVIGGEAEAGHALQAVLARLGVQARVGQLGGHAVLHLIQRKISAGQGLAQVHVDLEALVVRGVGALQADVQHAEGQVLALGPDRFDGGPGGLVGQYAGVGGLALGQVHVVHRADHGDIARGDLGDAGGGHGDGIIRAVGRAHGQGLRRLGLPQHADAPVVPGLGQPDGIGVGHADSIDLDGDLKRRQDLRQRDILPAGDIQREALVLIVELDRVLQHIVREAAGPEGEALQQAALHVLVGQGHRLGGAVADLVRHDVIQRQRHAVHHRFRIGKHVDGRVKLHRDDVRLGVLQRFVGQADVKGRVAGQAARRVRLRRRHARALLRRVHQVQQVRKGVAGQGVHGKVALGQLHHAQGGLGNGLLDGLFDGLFGGLFDLSGGLDGLLRGL